MKCTTIPKPKFFHQLNTPFVMAVCPVGSDQYVYAGAQVHGHRTYVALTSTENNHASNPQNMHMGEDRKPMRFAFTEKEQMACLASYLATVYVSGKTYLQQQ